MVPFVLSSWRENITHVNELKTKNAVHENFPHPSESSCPHSHVNALKDESGGIFQENLPPLNSGVESLLQLGEDANREGEDVALQSSGSFKLPSLGVWCENACLTLNQQSFNV